MEEQNAPHCVNETELGWFVFAIIIAVAYTTVCTALILLTTVLVIPVASDWPLKDQQLAAWLITAGSAIVTLAPTILLTRHQLRHKHGASVKRIITTYAITAVIAGVVAALII